MSITSDIEIGINSTVGKPLESTILQLVGFFVPNYNFNYRSIIIDFATCNFGQNILKNFLAFYLYSVFMLLLFKLLGMFVLLRDKRGKVKHHLSIRMLLILASKLMVSIYCVYFNFDYNRINLRK